MRSFWSQIAWVVITTMVAPGLPGRSEHEQDVEETGETAEIARPQQVRGGFVSLQPARDDDIRRDLETQLAHRVNDIQTTCHLTDAQAKKLELGGQGDIKRYLDQRHSSIKKFEETGPLGARRFAIEMHGFKTSWEQLFDWGSLLSKTAVTMLSQDQFERYVQLLRDKNLGMYRRSVTEAVRELALKVELLKSERDKLSSLLLSETLPPLRFGTKEYAFVMFQVSTLPEAKLKQTIPEDQWKTFLWILSPWGKSKDSLRRDGFVFGDESAVNRSAQARSMDKTGELTNSNVARSKGSEAQP